MPNRIVKFVIEPEGQPQQKLNYAAYLFNSNGTFIEMRPVTNNEFSLQLEDSDLAGKRILIAPHQEQHTTRKHKPEIRDLEQIAFEPGIKKAIDGTIHLNPIPSYYWLKWFICHCHVHGKVLNWCSGKYNPVYKARVHVCEVDPVFIWLKKLPESDLLQLKKDILSKLQVQPVVNKPVPEPRPGFRISSASQAINDGIQSPFLNEAKTLQLAENKESLGEKPELLTASLESTNKALLYSDSAHLVRQYFIDNYTLFYPWFCYFWRPWYWYRSDEITVLETDENGIFDGDISYFCWVDKPDLYFWIEYNIDGVWTTVYRPPIMCHTYWDYDCGSDVFIYLNDQRIPCITNPLGQGKVVIVNTIGRNVNVNQIPQNTAAGGGLTKGGEPFGGSIEPNVTFGEALLTAANPVKYYRWSYKKHSDPDTDYKPILNDVGRHYLHMEWVAGELQFSYPVYALGPQPSTDGLFEIQTARNSVTNEPWAVIDGRYDTASAFFNTPSLENGNVALAAGFYDLKLEIFHADKTPVNFTTDGIELRVPTATIDAPFGSQTVTTVDPDDAYKIKNGAGDLLAFKMLIRVDNNATFSQIYEVQCDGSSAGECGFLKYLNKNTSQATISFRSVHPHDFATYSFNIIRGSIGTIYNISGNTLPAPGDVFEILEVADLLDSCDKAAFSENLYTYAKATDGWQRLSYLDTGDIKAFALTD